MKVQQEALKKRSWFVNSKKVAVLAIESSKQTNYLASVTTNIIDTILTSAQNHFEPK